MGQKRKKRIVFPDTVRVLGRSLRRHFTMQDMGWAEYEERGAMNREPGTLSTDLKLTKRGGGWQVSVRFWSSGSQLARVTSEYHPTWRKAVAEAERLMLELFQGLGPRLGYEVER